MRRPALGNLFVSGAFGAGAVVFAWVAVAISATGPACDSGADACYGVPSTGASVPWQVLAAAAGAACLVLIVLCVRSSRRRLGQGSTEIILASVCGLGAIVAAWGYDRSNVYFDGGMPYRQGDQKWWVAALLLIPPALALTALISSRFGSRQPHSRG
jgi:hypothetical protein